MHIGYKAYSVRFLMFGVAQCQFKFAIGLT